MTAEAITARIKGLFGDRMVEQNDTHCVCPSLTAEGRTCVPRRPCTRRTGLVTMERLGRAHSFRFNRDHLLAEGIPGILTSGNRAEEARRAEGPAWEAPSVSVALFGSAARRRAEPAAATRVWPPATPCSPGLPPAMRSAAPSRGKVTGEQATVRPPGFSAPSRTLGSGPSPPRTHRLQGHRPLRGRGREEAARPGGAPPGPGPGRRRPGQGPAAASSAANVGFSRWAGWGSNPQPSG